MYDLAKMLSQEGKIAVVTGANIGLGYETTLALAGKGAEVILACRSKSKAEKAMSDIHAKHPESKLNLILLDLSKKQSIEAFAAELKSQYNHIDLLINNAGIMVPPYWETAEGFESQWGVNYLGHFYLTHLLMESLQKADSARVVTLSSIAHRNGKIYWENINRKEDYVPMESYQQSKLACLMFAYELDRRLKAKNSSVISLASHPGVAVTNLVANGPTWLKVLTPLIGWMFQSAKKGARSTVMAALDPSLKGGEYLGPMGGREMSGEPGIVDSNEISKDLGAAERLWSLSEKQLGITFDV